MNKEIENRIEKQWKIYNDAIDLIILDVFEKQIKPYLQKHSYHFLAGNGTYYIYKGDIDIDPELLPKWLYDILEGEIPGMHSNSIGTLCPDYHPD